VRQIIGWREYMRIYWLKPDYANFSIIKKSYQNGWTGKTKMHCLRDTINQSLNYGYAHHIQRLMITGTLHFY
jgi:deoxyribodipyrimidine photolyase-related protein